MKNSRQIMWPASLEEAVSALAAGPRIILAGGTDVFLDFKIDHCRTSA